MAMSDADVQKQVYIVRGRFMYCVLSVSTLKSVGNLSVRIKGAWRCSHSCRYMERDT